MVSVVSVYSNRPIVCEDDVCDDDSGGPVFCNPKTKRDGAIEHVWLVVVSADNIRPIVKG